MSRWLNGGMAERTRIEAGRKRAETAKRTVVLASAAAFVTALALVRQGHPATATQQSTGAGARSRSSSFSDDGERVSRYGGGRIAPSSGGTPPIVTATS